MSAAAGAGAAVSTAELRSALEPELRARFGRGGGIARLRWCAFASATSYPIEALEVHLEDGRELRLLLKEVGADALLPGARDAKPELVRDPRREIHVYREILAGAGLGTAECYAAVSDEERGRFWLVLERVTGVELFQVGDLGSWKDAARWLASAHERLAPHASGPAAGPLLRYDAAYYRLWARRALEFATGPSRAVLEALAAPYERIVERLVALPQTVIHGEFYASNILVAGRGPARRVCAVDWEMAAVGPGLMDLAALTAGSWSEEERGALAMAYLDAGGGGAWSDPEPFLAALDLCRLHLAMQWLGWSPHWTPPREHAHDWLAEAVAVMERVGR